MKDLTIDKTKHFIGKSTFAFAVRFIGPTPEKLLDPTYLNFNMYESHYDKNGGKAIQDINSNLIDQGSLSDDFTMQILT